ncbi:MAG: flagellar protein FlaG [Bacteriodetes bacterium]|nr:flagellar protein FlaG [Bacteroidota bacterium]
MSEPVASISPVLQAAIVQKLDSEVDGLHARPVHQANAHSNEPSPQNTEQHTYKPSYSGLEKKLQEVLAEQNQTVQFSVDQDTKRTVVRVVDNSTKEVVRQYPTNEILKVSRMIAKSAIQKGEVTDERV